MASLDAGLTENESPICSFGKCVNSDWWQLELALPVLVKSLLQTPSLLSVAFAFDAFPAALNVITLLVKIPLKTGVLIRGAHMLALMLDALGIKRSHCLFPKGKEGTIPLEKYNVHLELALSLM